MDKLDSGSKMLLPLVIGDVCRVHNQSGNNPSRWGRTGTVMAVGNNDKYVVRMNGSRRLTTRN